MRVGAQSRVVSRETVDLLARFGRGVFARRGRVSNDEGKKIGRSASMKVLRVGPEDAPLSVIVSAAEIHPCEYSTNQASCFGGRGTRVNRVETTMTAVNFTLRLDLTSESEVIEGYDHGERPSSFYVCASLGVVGMRPTPRLRRIGPLSLAELGGADNNLLQTALQFLQGEGREKFVRENIGQNLCKDEIARFGIKDRGAMVLLFFSTDLPGEGYWLKNFRGGQDGLSTTIKDKNDLGKFYDAISALYSDLVGEAKT